MGFAGGLELQETHVDEYFPEEIAEMMFTWQGQTGSYTFVDNQPTTSRKVPTGLTYEIHFTQCDFHVDIEEEVHFGTSNIEGRGMLYWLIPRVSIASPIETKAHGPEILESQLF